MVLTFRAMRGTDAAYGATRCAVLTPRMVLTGPPDGIEVYEVMGYAARRVIAVLGTDIGAWYNTRILVLLTSPYENTILGICIGVWATLCCYDTQSTEIGVWGT
eukprot:40685-Rhodomonas_salina.1